MHKALMVAIGFLVAGCGGGRETLRGMAVLSGENDSSAILIALTEPQDVPMEVDTVHASRDGSYLYARR